MGNKSYKNLKALYSRERIFKEIAKATLTEPKDLFSLRQTFVKHKIVESGNKFDAVIEELKNENRIVFNGKNVQINSEQVKSGALIITGKKAYVLIDKDNHQYGIDLQEVKGFKSNDKVSITLTYLENKERAIPFIIAKESENQSVKHKTRLGEFQTNNNQSNLVYGRVMKSDHDNLVFIPNDKSRFKQNILILNEKKYLPKFQDKICKMEVISQEDGTSQAMGYIREVKGDAGNPVAEYDAIAESHGANMSWSDEAVIKEIEQIPSEVDLSKYTLIDEDGDLKSDDGKEKIVDLRSLMFTTTDPATCKDMDDAIYSTFDEDGNLVVYTAVANVTKYVDLNSEIGRRYIQGAFTTYTPNKAYNILPPELSTNICSLNPHVDRLAFVVKSVVDTKTGMPISSKIIDAVIRSHEKYSYEEAQEIVDNNKDITFEGIIKKIYDKTPLSKEEQVILNNKASDILWKGFKKRDIINFNSNNAYDVRFSPDMSDIIDITPQENCHYHKVIEAFMLTANEASAEFALKRGIPIPYRVHEAPNDDRNIQAEEFFGYMGIDFDGKLTPQSIKRIIVSAKGTNQEKVINNFLIRMQSKAKYNLTPNPNDVGFVSSKTIRENSKKRQDNSDFDHSTPYQTNKSDKYDPMFDETLSHFGLQSRHYSHTTSPIRRVTDYVTHYNILAYMKGEKLLDEEYVQDLCQWANQMQDEIDLAEREIQETNSAIYCEGHIGDIMKGYVCGFKKLIDGKNATINDLIVLVENEEKGIKVQIPAREVLESKGINTKNVVLSPFGSAIINKESRTPLLRLCSPVTFKITKANRMTREIDASTSLNQENIFSFANERRSSSNSQFGDFKDMTFKPERHSSEENLKRERMLASREYKTSREEWEREQEEFKRYKGKKYKKEIERKGFDDVTEREAYEIDRKRSKQRKQTIQDNKKVFDLSDFEDENI